MLLVIYIKTTWGLRSLPFITCISQHRKIRGKTGNQGPLLSRAAQLFTEHQILIFCLPRQMLQEKNREPVRYLFLHQNGNNLTTTQQGQAALYNYNILTPFGISKYPEIDSFVIPYKNYQHLPTQVMRDKKKDGRHRAQSLKM